MIISSLKILKINYITFLMFIIIFFKSFGRLEEEDNI